MTCCRAGMRRKAGVPNSASASRKDMRAPARMAGRTSGSVIRQVVRAHPAPKSAADRSISEGTISRALLTKAKA